MEDKMVELKRFIHLSDAEMLANLLRSEGIACYVRDMYINQIYGGAVDFGGVKVELLEKDLERAKDIMKDFGYLEGEKGEISMEHDPLSDENEDNEDIEETEETGEIEDIEVESENIQPEQMNDEYGLKKARQSKILTVFCILIIVLVVIIILLNKYFNGCC